MKVNKDFSIGTNGLYTTKKITVTLNDGTTAIIDMQNSLCDEVGTGESCSFTMKNSEDIICNEKCDTIEVLLNAECDIDDIFEIADEIVFDYGPYNLSDILASKKDALFENIAKPFGLYSQSKKTSAACAVENYAYEDDDYAYEDDDYAYEDDDYAYEDDDYAYEDDDYAYEDYECDDFCDEESAELLEALKEKQKSLIITVEEMLAKKMVSANDISTMSLVIKKDDGASGAESVQQDILETVFGYEDSKKIIKILNNTKDDIKENLTSLKFMQFYSETAIDEIVALWNCEKNLPVHYTITQKLNDERKVDMEIIIG